MVNKDFQNGFALGLVSNGIYEELLDYTVTFLVDNKPYLVQSVNNGTAIDEPIIRPITNDGQNVQRWKSGDTLITFPYTPTEDIELVPDFTYKPRTELEVVKDQKFGYINERTFIKKYDGWAIGGFCNSGFKTGTFSLADGTTSWFCTGGILIGETPISVESTLTNSATPFIYDRDNKTYYVNKGYWYQDATGGDAQDGIDIYSIPEIQEAINNGNRNPIEAILDYYFCYI